MAGAGGIKGMKIVIALRILEKGAAAGVNGVTGEMLNYLYDLPKKHPWN